MCCCCCNALPQHSCLTSASLNGPPPLSPPLFPPPSLYPPLPSTLPSPLPPASPSPPPFNAAASLPTQPQWPLSSHLRVQPMAGPQAMSLRQQSHCYSPSTACPHFSSTIPLLYSRMNKNSTPANPPAPPPFPALTQSHSHSLLYFRQHPQGCLSAPHLLLQRPHPL